MTTIRVEAGDCLEVMAALAAEGVTVDAVVTDPPYDLTTARRFGKQDAKPPKGGTVFARSARGFMGKEWDGTGVAFTPDVWRLAFDLLKPGGHLLAFGGARTYHRLACAIEDAGFEIRDQIMWIYGSGFPKSHDQGDGWGTALKPAHEPIVVARRPLGERTVAANVLRHGTGAINVDGCKIGEESTSRWPANVCHDGSDEVEAAFAAFGEKTGQSGVVTGDEPSSKTNNVYGRFDGRLASSPRGDFGTASRFFYCAKESSAWRGGSKHPTVKPIDLMRWLVRLVTPPGGTVLDPFAGTGTTGEASRLEGMGAILIEREADYIADIHRRLGRASGADAPLFVARA